MSKKITSTATPTTLQWAKGLSIFQISVGVLAAVFFMWLFSVGESSELISEMKLGVSESLNKDSLYLSSAEGMGYIFGVFALALVGPALALVAIARRSKPWAIASLILNGLMLVTGFSPVTLAVMVLMLVKPSRVYLNLSK